MWPGALQFEVFSDCGQSSDPEIGARAQPTALAPAVVAQERVANGRRCDVRIVVLGEA